MQKFCNGHEDCGSWLAAEDECDSSVDNSSLLSMKCYAEDRITSDTNPLNRANIY